MIWNFPGRNLTSIGMCRYYLRIFFLEPTTYSRHVLHHHVSGFGNQHPRVAGVVLKEWRAQKVSEGPGTKRVIEYGIRLDWPDVTDENAKPAYMRNMAYVPCDCKTCFFCIEGLTHGVDHQSRGHQATNAVETCPNNQTIIANSPIQCRVCYRQIRLKYPNWTVEKVSSKCHKTHLGCCKCQVIVCETCWPSFGHDLEAKKWLVESTIYKCQNERFTNSPFCQHWTISVKPFTGRRTFYSLHSLYAAWCSCWRPFTMVN